MTDTACVGYLHAGDVSSRFHLSMTAFIVRETAKVKAGVHSPVFDGGGHIATHSGVNVSTPRNDVVRRFLDTSADWLWMLDADMEFAPDTLDRLMGSADPDPSAEHYAPIVGGLCFGLASGDAFPTCYGFADTDDGTRIFRYDNYPRDSMFRVDATGAACLLVHRTVLTAMLERGYSHAFPWFQETEMAGRVWGEDLTFCHRAGELGFPVWVDTSVRVGHHKSIVVTESMFIEQQSREETADG